MGADPTMDCKCVDLGPQLLPPPCHSLRLNRRTPPDGGWCTPSLYSPCGLCRHCLNWTPILLMAPTPVSSRSLLGFTLLHWKVPSITSPISVFFSAWIPVLSAPLLPPQGALRDYVGHRSCHVEPTPACRPAHCTQVKPVHLGSHSSTISGAK